MIRFINSRHAPVHAQYMREKFPKKADDEQQYEGDMPMREGWDALNNWG